MGLEELEPRLTPSTVNPLAGTPDTTSTGVSSAAATFSQNNQDVMLKANVADTTNSTITVDAGTVKFTVVNSQGTTVGTAVTAAVASNGEATVNYILPGGGLFTPAGSYTIDADYSGGTDSSGNSFAAGTGGNTLTVSAAPTTTTANNATAPFSTSNQDITLSASVTSSAGTVNEGNVQFALFNSKTGQPVGTAATGAVTSNGTASVTYSLPAFTNVGSYTIGATYSDSSGNFDSSFDDSHTLTVSAAATTTTAGNATTTFSTSTQDVTLRATVVVAGTTTPVTEGQVQFTLVNSRTGKTVGTATTGTITSNGVSGTGTASVTYGLPAFTMAGSYTIEADYSDSTGKYPDSSDDSHTLTVGGAATTTTVSSAAAASSTSNQDVTLTANVSSSAGTVNEGTVTFTIVNSQGITIGTAISGTVSNGQVSVSYVLPGSTAVGSYTIEAEYSDDLDNFTASSGQGTLAVNPANTSLTLTTVSIVPNRLNGTAQVTLTAQANDPGNVGGNGVVSFTVAGVSGQGNVVNGTASVQLTVPLLAVIKFLDVSLANSDAASASFANGDPSTPLFLNIWSAVLPTSLTIAADGSEQIQLQLAGLSLLGFSYSPSGLLTRIDVRSLSLPVTYTNLSGHTLVTIAGMPWQVNFVGPDGQNLVIASMVLTGDGSAEWSFFTSTGQVI